MSNPPIGTDQPEVLPLDRMVARQSPWKRSRSALPPLVGSCCSGRPTTRGQKSARNTSAHQMGEKADFMSRRCHALCGRDPGGEFRHPEQRDRQPGNPGGHDWSQPPFRQLPKPSASAQPLLRHLIQCPELRVFVHQHRPFPLGGGGDPGSGHREAMVGLDGGGLLQEGIAAGHPSDRQ